MKKNKLFVVIFLILFILFFINNCVHASMADYTDEDAEKDTEKMIQEHNKQFDSTKSNNNYLKDLIIRGGELSPNFDRQIVEYSVKIKNRIDEIEIIANSEDSRATVKGNGRFSVKDISECKIEVQAESGTTRTYFIKIINENKNDNDVSTKSELDENTIEENTVINHNIIKEEPQLNMQKNSSLKVYSIIAVLIIAFLTCLFIIVKKNHKNSKH